MVAQPILQEHLCWSSSAGGTAVENLLKTDRVASKVTSIETGKLYCYRRDSTSIGTVVSTLATCPRLMRLVVNTWSGLEVVPSIPSPPIGTFPQLTTFYIGCGRYDGWIPLRTFCLILQLMPTLHTLTIGDIRNTSSDTISDIPYPPCQLRSFAVSDARSVEFQSYDWLLHNSKNSLRQLHTHYMSSHSTSTKSLLRVLPDLGSSLREFRCLGCWDQQLTLCVLQHCHKLEALACCNSPNILSGLASAACAKTLQRFTATQVSLIEFPEPLDDGRYYFNSSRGLFMEVLSPRELVAMRRVVQRRVLPQLKEWKLQTVPFKRLINIHVVEVVALKNECDKHGVVLDLARYDEVIKQ